ncbi:MAG: glycosyltransferase family 4 protein [Candidatus Komeilibacteria bacterium]|nr:glycosyltransferase family 4 protein [Candidatus Komeilibacteria bacterium]
MRIGIDARMYGPAARGLGRYVQKLVDNLALSDTDNEYFIFLGEHNWDEFQTSNSKFIKILAPYHWYTLSEQVWFPWKLYRSHLDVMHFPHFNVPLFYHNKFVVTIHDLIISHYPDSRATTLPPLIYKLKLAAYKVVLKNAVRRAAKIMAVSDFTRRDIIRYYPEVEGKITVTHEGYEVEHAGSANVNLQAMGIVKPYLLYVGAAYPHKNLYRLLQAWKLAQSHLQGGYQLVIVGRHDFFYQQLLKDVENYLDKDVIFTGYVSDASLPNLYQYSAAYVFPSYLEGFGLPAIEAQSYGVPVLAANNSSLPEILGDSALYFDPFDINLICRAMVDILQNDDLREDLRERGYRNYLQFDWAAMAKKARRVYEDVK